MPIKRKSDEAYAVLRRRIMSADLRPGAAIDERALMSELGVGRTPLREAVLRLEHEGLLASPARRGYIVAETSPLDLFRAFELRREIECFAAGRAAERRRQQDVAALDHLLAEMESRMEEAASDIAWNLEADEAFHRLVVAASDNRFAEQTASFLFGLSVRSLYLARVNVTLVRDEIGAYRAVVEAIREGNSEAASAAMGVHLTVSPVQALLAGSGSERLAV